MNANIFMKSEFLSKGNIRQEELETWEAMKLVQPSGFTDDKIPCYSVDAVQKVEHIRKLLDLGYDLETIQKIIKKVGLPKKESASGPKSGDKTQYLTVGALAEKVGLSPRTIKHWEDKGIIEPDMRSEGGFRLYSETFIFLCQLIRDLQLFGYSLEEIHEISTHFKEFIAYSEAVESHTPQEVNQKMNLWLLKINEVFDKTKALKEGIQRWEDLLKKKRREIQTLKNQNQKRLESSSDKKRGRKQEAS